MSRIKCALGLAALAVTASAEAGVVTTSSQSAFNIITTSRAYVRESFAFTAPGAYPIARRRHRVERMEHVGRKQRP